MARITVAYSENYMRWQLGEGHPTQPVRARIASKLIMQSGWHDLQMVEAAGDFESMRSRLGEVHDRSYLRALRRGECDEWEGLRPDLTDTAALMFAGTVQLTEKLLKARKKRGGSAPGVWFNPQGAKHHAMRMRSGGFCVFADLAWAAGRLAGPADADGLKVAVLDWDAHHGDGTESVLLDREDIMTISIHQSGIFPGTGLGHNHSARAFNYPLPAGAGDGDYLAALGRALELLEAWKPDVILVAAGADGLEGDPLTGLSYSVEGLTKGAEALGKLAGRLGADLLVGGAGGYQALDMTPLTWASTVLGMARGLESLVLVE